MNQKYKIIYWLRERGSVGIKNYEFPQKFILNYKARLDELRTEGYDIKTIKVEGNVWKYVLDEKPKNKESWQIVKKRKKQKELEEKGQGILI